MYCGAPMFFSISRTTKAVSFLMQPFPMQDRLLKDKLSRAQRDGAFKLEAINYLRQGHNSRETIAYLKGKYPRRKAPDHGMLSKWRKAIEKAEKTNELPGQPAKRSKNRASAWPMFEEALFQKVTENPLARIDDAILLECALHLWPVIQPIHYPRRLNTTSGGPVLTLSWIARFKRRYNIQIRSRDGELASTFLGDRQAMVQREQQRAAEIWGTAEEVSARAPALERDAGIGQLQRAGYVRSIMSIENMLN